MPPQEIHLHETASDDESDAGSGGTLGADGLSPRHQLVICRILRGLDDLSDFWFVRRIIGRCNLGEFERCQNASGEGDLCLETASVGRAEELQCLAICLSRSARAKGSTTC